MGDIKEILYFWKYQLVAQSCIIVENACAGQAVVKGHYIPQSVLKYLETFPGKILKTKELYPLGNFHDNRWPERTSHSPLF